MPVEATEGISEGSFPDSAENLESIPAKIGAIQFRVHGLLDRTLIAAKRLAALITKMENREYGAPPGPPDYPQAPWVNYGGNQQEPSWQTSLLGKIIAPLIVIGIPAILATLWTMNSRLSDLSGDNRVIVQRLDQQDAHLKATDAQVEEIKRELWVRKH
jgi:hypothetical protein